MNKSLLYIDISHIKVLAWFMEDNDLHIRHEDFIEIAGEILAKGKRFSFCATGTSMSPFIRDGDTVIIMPLSYSLRLGDVVLLKTDRGRLILHRVIKKQQAGVITRGDASLSDDELTPYKDIIGKVIKVSGKGYNFHLRFPINYLLGRGIILPKKLNRYPFLLKLGRKIADILG